MVALMFPVPMLTVYVHLFFLRLQSDFCGVDVHWTQPVDSVVVRPLSVFDEQW
jgi:hypothetical protein